MTSSAKREKGEGNAVLEIFYLQQREGILAQSLIALEETIAHLQGRTDRVISRLHSEEEALEKMGEGVASLEMAHILLADELNLLYLKVGNNDPVNCKGLTSTHEAATIVLDQALSVIRNLV